VRSLGLSPVSRFTPLPQSHHLTIPFPMPLNYDILATAYARNRSIHPGVLGCLVETGRVSAASDVLEVGCGTGNYSIALHEAADCRGAGVDPSAEMLAVTRSRTDALYFRQGRAESLPFTPPGFDLIFSVDVIHHLTDRRAFFREAARLLGPGGRLCTVTDSAEDIRRRVPLSSHFPETVAVELARYPSIETLRAEMAEAGFTSIWMETTKQPYPLTDIQGYRERAYSSLHLIPDDAFRRGIERLEQAPTVGPIDALSLYTLVWGKQSTGSHL
jgi:SAM-dependent methyltransferase